METQTRFRVDKSKCIKCGKCLNICSGLVLRRGADGFPEMTPFERFGWRGCWRCQHCLAVCPQGAITIFGKRPEDSLPSVPEQMGEYMERLVVGRRSCRRFLQKNVKPELVSRILSAMTAAPTGGNAIGVEYTVIDDIDRVDEIRQEAYGVMEAKAARHIYTHSFSDFYYKGTIKRWNTEKYSNRSDL